ncbi:MAG: DUF86 domain-containing protein [Thermodesulfobacteriota bacterium]
MKDDRLYLVHVRECIIRILEFTADGKDAFFADRKTQDAVLRNLHTLSESIQRVSPGLKVDYPTLKWREIAAFRNVIVHDYLGIDLDQIWDIIERDLPVLKTEVETILKKLES